jgi:hypothetical protein
MYVIHLYFNRHNQVQFKVGTGIESDLCKIDIRVRGISREVGNL